ncbi:MAG TPA: hypothetical protein VK845_02860 [Gemmatimonadales bacterium]|nr:hypothetical protein [Gemmatimonadales bacterium]
MHGTWWERVEAKVPVGVTVLAAILVLLLAPREANGNVSCAHEAGVLTAPSADFAAAPVLAGTVQADSEDCPECPAQHCPTSAVCSPHLASDVPQAQVLVIPSPTIVAPPCPRHEELVSTALPPPTPPPE